MAPEMVVGEPVDPGQIDTALVIPLLLAFPQQGSGWTNNHKSKEKVALLWRLTFSTLQKGEKCFALLRIQNILEHLI